MDYFGRTTRASEETRKKTATEKINLKITAAQIKSYSETQTMPTLQYLADELCEDNDMEYVILKEKEQASLEKIEVGKTDSILTKLKEYPYEFEIDSDLKLASINGMKVATVPENDGDKIVSMTKSELDNYIETAINSKLQGYAKLENLTKTQIVNAYTSTETTVANSISLGNYNLFNYDYIMISGAFAYDGDTISTSQLYKTSTLSNNMLIGLYEDSYAIWYKIDDGSTLTKKRGGTYYIKSIDLININSSNN